MMKRFSKVVMFVVLAAVFAGIFMIVATVPQMVVEVWKYMSIDLGYKWVINMLVGFLAAIAVNVICSRAGWGKVGTVVLAIVVMLVVIVAFECVVWHPKEFGGMIASKLSPTKIIYMLLGILASMFSYVVVEISQKAPTEQRDNPQPQPRQASGQGAGSREPRSGRNDPMKD